MPAERKFRIREIVFAVAMGGLAAGGAALTLDAMRDGEDEPMTEFDAARDMTYPVTDFDQISTSGPQDVEVRYGEQLSVRAEGSVRALEQVEVVVEGKRLNIRPKEGVFRGNWGILDEVTFYVTMPKITELVIAGSGDISVDRIEGESFSATVGGPGTIEIGELKVTEADFMVAGAGNLVAAGTADDTKVTIAGVGEFSASALRSKTASIAIGGTGDVALSVDEEARISITGAGDVDISGPGRCSVTRMGAGEVRCSGPGGDEDEE